MIADARLSPKPLDRWRNLLSGVAGRTGLKARFDRYRDRVAGKDPDLAWQRLPREARVYVAAIVAAGLAAFVWLLPSAYPQPWLFTAVLAVAGVTSTWKVNLPIPLTSGSTLSVSCAANLAALLLLGPAHAMLIAVAGVWVQCTKAVSRRYPWYRSAFSMCAEAITMAVTAAAYIAAGGVPAGRALAPLPIAVAVGTYFFVNTGLVAAAIGLSTGRPVRRVWQDDFLWSGLSFAIAGAVGAAAAFVVQSGQAWVALLGALPVYLTYRTYQWVVRRIARERTLTSAVTAVMSEQAAGIQRQYREVVEVLLETQMSERELAAERERLARELSEMTHLQETRDRALEREHAARENAERVSRLKDDFLATVSHELRTPLTAILGWAEMLRNGALEGERRARANQAIYTSARHQARLVDELLDVARIMAGKLPLDCTALDVRDVVHRAVEAAQPAAEAKRIDLTFGDDPSPGIVCGDATRLQQVVSNLLGNALKFTPEAGAVHVTLRRNGDDAELVVRDNGEGITPEFLSSMFDAFRQADGSTTRRHGGLGLGLSIVKHLVEAHRGSVAADSAGPGAGATFTVRLPLATQSGEEVHAVAAESAEDGDRAPATPSLAGLTVLVADDDDGCRMVAAAHLEQRGAAVLSAASAAEALELLQSAPVDVLLADVGMPVEDGYMLVRRVRALPSAIASVPAAAFTAFARDEDRRRAREAGFDMHVSKPLDGRTLVAAVATLAGRNRSAHSV